MLFSRDALVKWLGELRQSREDSKEYDEMLLDASKTSSFLNILAGTFTWMLLGGFLVMLPALPKIQRSDSVKNLMGDGAISKAIQSVPALVFALIMLAVGLVGVLVLWHRKHANFIWIKDHLFYPSFMRGLLGLATTLTHVYATTPPVWETVPKVVTVISGACMTLNLGLVVWCQGQLDTLRKQTESSETQDDKTTPPEYSACSEKKATSSDAAMHS